MRFLAPAGTAMDLRDLAKGMRRGLGATEAAASLVAGFHQTSGLPHCWPMSSGRAAMTIILRAMQEVCTDRRRDEVVIPAYTCYSVPASVERAGLRPRLCDVDPATLAMCPESLDRLDFSRVLAIVSSNLYGIPNPLAEYEAIARRKGVLMLDDAAQALGARVGNRAVGAFGDAGVYSFDKGKIISTIQGGTIVAVEGPLAAAIEAQFDTVPPSPVRESAINVLKLPVYALCLRPVLYGLVRRLPFLGLGRTEYQVPSPVTRLGALQTGVAAEFLPKVDEINAVRRANAKRLDAAIRDLQRVLVPTVANDAEPVYARFPIRIRDTDRRANVIAELEARGIGATASYPSALQDVPEVKAQLRSPNQDFPGARELALQIVTLPTHAYCPPDLGDRIRTVLQRVLPGSAVTA